MCICLFCLCLVVCLVCLVSVGSGCLVVGILQHFSEIVKTFGNFRKFGNKSETELVEALLGRASFRTHPKEILVMDYTYTL